MTPRQQAIQSLVARLQAGDKLDSRERVGDKMWLVGDLMVAVKGLGYNIEAKQMSPIVKSKKWWENQARRYATYSLRNDK